ncbi:MAG: hypothetical protein KY467_06225 [Gemmatimonadetes bacterium]|nr:hypothetical protein [Gemmatimonadota bacterium]
MSQGYSLRYLVYFADGSAVEMTTWSNGPTAAEAHEAEPRLMHGRGGFWQGSTFYPWHQIMRIEHLSTEPHV